MNGTQYRAKAWITGSTVFWIFVMTSVGMSCMFFSMMLGAPVLLAAAVLMGTIYLGMYMVTGAVVYTLDKGGIHLEFEPNMLKDFWKKYTFQFYPWNNIKNFRAGEDANRGLEKFKYLTINMHDGKKLEINTKKGDWAQFELFLETFRTYVEAQNSGVAIDDDLPIFKESLKSTDIKVEPAMASSPVSPTDTPIRMIKEKPDFYSTILAKLLTLIFIIITIGILLAMIGLGNYRATNVLRLLVIIIPGTIYMIWRTFLKKSN